MRVVRMAAVRCAARVIGQGMNPDLQPGQWEFSFSTRASTADKHYSLDEEQTQRQTLGTYVVNKQRAYRLRPSVSGQFALRYSIRFGGPKRPSAPVRPTAPAPPIAQ